MSTLPGPSVDDFSSSSRTLALDTSKSSSVLTMEPYSYPSLASNNSRRFKPRRLGNLEITPGTYETNNYSKFLVLKMKNGQRMRDFDMFTLNREITSICQKEPKISFLNDGSLLVEVLSIEDSSKILSIPSLSGSDVESTPHRTLNQSRGVIRSVELLRYSEEKLQKEFEDQGVVNVKQMKKTVGGLVTPLPTYVLTFNRVKLPNVIHAAWLRLEVRPYIPSCRRCFYCQRYGHVISSCRRKIKGEKGVCVQCGQDEHGECSNSPLCVNCGEGHSASWKKCTRYLFEQEVQALRAKEHLSFQEARQRVNSVFINSGKTFSSLFKNTSPPNRNPADGSNSQPKNSSSNMSPASLQNFAKTRSSNAKTPKRRLSGEREENPSSRVHLTNSFELLSDEMDTENPGISLNSAGDQEGSSIPAVSLVQPGTLVSVSAVEQAGTTTSACDADQTVKCISACLSEQVENSTLVSEEAKSHASGRSVDQAKASTPPEPLERADSFVSASSEQELSLPSLENESSTREEDKSTGATPKRPLSKLEQRKMHELPTRTLKLPNKIPKEFKVSKEPNKASRELKDSKGRLKSLPNKR